MLSAASYRDKQAEVARQLVQYYSDLSAKIDRREIPWAELSVQMATRQHQTLLQRGYDYASMAGGGLVGALTINMLILTFVAKWPEGTAQEVIDQSRLALAGFSGVGVGLTALIWVSPTLGAVAKAFIPIRLARARDFLATKLNLVGVDDSLSDWAQAKILIKAERIAARLMMQLTWHSKDIVYETDAYEFLNAYAKASARFFQRLSEHPERIDSFRVQYFLSACESRAQEDVLIKKRMLKQ